MVEETEGIILPDVDEEDYNKAGSKFIVMPPGATEVFLDIECGLLDWDTPGLSMMVPVTVIESGPNEGKEDKISFGVKKDGIWKGKEIYEAVTNGPMPMQKGADGKNHPAPNPSNLLGKPAVGQWIVRKGHKGGDPTAEEVFYPKLQKIYPAGEKLSTEPLL